MILPFSLSNVPWLCCEILFFWGARVGDWAAHLVESSSLNPGPRSESQESYPLGYQGTPSLPILKREFTMSGRGILSNVVVASVEVIMWNPHHLIMQKEYPFPFPSFLPFFLPSILPQIYRNLYL